MANYQPPPTYTDPVEVDPHTKKAKFSPIWLKWFVDLAETFSKLGVTTGSTIDHDSLGGLQGGLAGEYYHLSQTEAANAGILAAGTSGGIPGYTGPNTLSSSALLTQFGIVLGGGAGATPATTAAMTDGQLLVGQTGAAPLAKTVSGNVILSAAGVATIQGDVAVGKFGCNGASVQASFASGGALAAYATGAFGLDSDAHMHALYNLVVAMRAALVANGIMS